MSTSSVEVVQCSLRADNARMVAWICNDPRLKPGVRVTLKGCDELWTVESKGMVQMKAGLKRSNLFGSIKDE